MSKTGWIGVDLDGTLAKYGERQWPDHIGEPIAPMVERIKQWLKQGVEVKIFTARVAGHGMWDISIEGAADGYSRKEELVRLLKTPFDHGVDRPSDLAIIDEIESLDGKYKVDTITPIKEWCKQHIGFELEVTNVKDFGMIQLWDDRAVRVVANTGETCCEN